MSQFIELASSDEKEVRALLEHLIKAFEEFLDSRDGEYSFQDAFMAVHNFHCVILLDIERRKGLTPEQQLFWRKAAVETFARAMENKPAWKKEKDDDEN